MPIIFLLLVGIVIVLVAALSPKERPYKQKGGANLPKQESNQKIYSDQDHIARLERQNDALKNKFDEKSQEVLNLQKQLKDAQLSIADLTNDLAKQKEWANRDEERIKKIVEKTSIMESDLKNKSLELEQGFEKNVKLNKELRECLDKIQVQEKEIKLKIDETGELKLKIDKGLKEAEFHKNETKNYLETINAMKIKQEESEWVSKDEFLSLKEKYDELTLKFSDMSRQFEAKKKQLEAMLEEKVTGIKKENPQSLPPQDITQEKENPSN